MTMTRLSETQTTLLSAAAARKTLSLLPPPASLKARGKALERALGALVKRGLAEETRARSDAASWRRSEEGARIGLVVTAAGLAAIGIDETCAGSGTTPADATSPAGEVAILKTARATAPASRPGGKLGKILAAVEGDGGATIGDLSRSAG